MKCFLLLLGLWLPTALRAQVLPLLPLQIAEQFVAPTGWADMKAYLCCEVATQARKQTLGQQIPPQLQRVSQLLLQGAGTAVVAVELRDSLSRNDFYLHFRKEASRWKLEAVRSLAMTQLGAPMLQLLTTLPPADIADYNLKHPDADHAFTVGNLRLWAAPDADIAAHFERNRADFEQVLRLVQAGPYFKGAPGRLAPTDEAAVNENPTVHALLRKLFLGQVSRRETGCSSCVEFIIGGKQRSTVGLLYEPNAAALPSMSPVRIIMLKPLGQGWYLYKTT
ncbi:hypothetical protein GCM10023185_05400 [Hymenobacter saemangeumensis]|uniref:Uncharacterized protein n=1 Tax=Hymenobacter saemangeumensis TaxID=1084522 RepID=A0ABP8I0Q6_9BACT